MCKELTCCTVGVERVDGLQGALIVRPQGPDPLQSLYDEERIINLDDWYHDLYAELTFATSRFVAAPAQIGQVFES